jgi:hypothetical protein
MEEIMRPGSLLIGLVLVLTFVLAPNDAVAQEAPRVLTVVFLDIAGDVPKFQEFFTRGDAIAKKYDSTGTVRVWLATFAGPNTGTVIVVTEYPSQVSMAQSLAKVVPSAEWQQLGAEFAAAGMRVTSNAVNVEITP